MRIYLKLIFALLFIIPISVFASFDTNLGYSSKGQQVIELQEFLRAEDVYSGPVTGNFYSLTLEGVKAFQLRENISPVSGFFGPLTRAKANEFLSSGSGSAQSSSTQELIEMLKQQLAALQERLNQLQADQAASGETSESQPEQGGEQPVEEEQTQGTSSSDPDFPKVLELRGILDDIIALVKTWDASENNWLCYSSNEYDKWQNYSYLYSAKNTIGRPNVPLFSRGRQCLEENLADYKNQLETLRDNL
jgi:peptidoglycan hydrolase-like protein with peptidoglycan-binding domain